MEPTRYIITILMITNTNATSLGNATLNISGLNNFNQMIDKLIAETELTVTVPIENRNGNETLKEERTSKQSDKGQEIALPNQKYTDSILDSKYPVELSIDTNRDAQINNLNVKRNNSKIIYINKTLPHNLTLDEKMEIIEKTNDFPEFLQSRRSFGENEKYEEFFKKMFDKPLGVDHGRGIVVKEEFSFEIEDDKPIHEPTASENMLYNNTFHKMNTPSAETFHGDGGHVPNIPFDLPPTPSTTHKNEETDLRNAKRLGGEKAMMPIPYHQDHSNNLLAELNKINTKINSVEDLLKKSIVKENDVTNYRRLVQNHELVKPLRSVGLLRPRNPQGVVPYTIYQPTLQNSIADSSVLSLQEKLIEERARNHFLNLKLEKVARAKQNVALLNELIRARSRLTLHLPTVLRRILFCGVPLQILPS